jgi:hypothetical protein
LSTLKIGFCKGDFNLLLGLFIPLVTSGEILCCVMIYRDQVDKSLEVHTVYCAIYPSLIVQLDIRNARMELIFLACLTLAMILLYVQAILATLAIIIGATKGSHDW